MCSNYLLNHPSHLPLKTPRGTGCWEGLMRGVWQHFKPQLFGKLGLSSGTMKTFSKRKTLCPLLPLFAVSLIAHTAMFKVSFFKFSYLKVIALNYHQASPSCSSSLDAEELHVPSLSRAQSGAAGALLTETAGQQNGQSRHS